MMAFLTEHLNKPLGDFPVAIAECQHRQLKQTQHARHLKLSLSARNAEIDQTIAFDVDLKNDAQRKARKTELASEDVYLDLCLDCQNASDKLTEIEIELEMLMNQFSVLKLEMRDAIARMELEAAA